VYEQIKAMGKRAKYFSDKNFNDERLYQTVMNIYQEVLT